jgi:hypothetical protein
MVRAGFGVWLGRETGKADSSAALRNDNKRTGNDKSKGKTTADSYAALRNDNKRTGNDKGKGKTTANSYTALRNDNKGQATTKARQQQIPTLRCGMTNQRAGTRKL